MKLLRFDIFVTRTGQYSMTADTMRSDGERSLCIGFSYWKFSFIIFLYTVESRIISVWMHFESWSCIIPSTRRIYRKKREFRSCRVVPFEKKFCQVMPELLSGSLRAWRARAHACRPTKNMRNDLSDSICAPRSDFTLRDNVRPGKCTGYKFKGAVRY